MLLSSNEQLSHFFAPICLTRFLSFALGRPVARGVRTNPPCSLAKFIVNETAAVQGTIIQPCSGIVTDGIQAIMQLLQGIVTYTSPVKRLRPGSRILIGENRP